MDNYKFNRMNSKNTNVKSRRIGAAIVIAVIVTIAFFMFFNMPSRKIVGTWVNEDGDAMIFDSDGYLNDYYGMPSKYSVKNGNLTIIRYAGKTVTYTVKFVGQNKLIISDEEGSFEEVFMRQ